MVGSVRLVVPVKEVFKIRLARLLVSLESCFLWMADVGLRSDGVARTAAPKAVRMENSFLERSILWIVGLIRLLESNDQLGHLESRIKFNHISKTKTGL